jgi:hypothetical protein
MLGDESGKVFNALPVVITELCRNGEKQLCAAI